MEIKQLTTSSSWGATFEWAPGDFKTLEEKTDLLREKINFLSDNDIHTFEVKLIDKNVFSSIEIILPILYDYNGYIHATSNTRKIERVIKETGFYSIINVVSSQAETIKKETELQVKKLDPSYEIKEEEESNGYCILS